ncbi:MAG TPA: magnesium transporter CorA family protein [Candidatus Nanoarchaeia archaeon]|nr:magnesium transporter CorA family protein [Candidatus Nanoarchaeia archaeon]
MIEILKPSEGKFETIDKFSPNSWVNVACPAEHELETLKKDFPVPDDFLHSLRDVDELPSWDEHEKCTCIIIKIPYNKKGNALEYSTVPLGILVTKENVITICYFENEVTAHLKSQAFAFTKTHLVFRLMFLATKLYLDYLNEIKKKMYDIESKLETTLQNKLVMKLLELEKDLVYFDTGLRANDILLHRFAHEQSKNKFIKIKTPEDTRLIENAIDENKQAIQMANIYSMILSNTLDAFTSIISNNLNIVIKVLTVITVMIALPTLVASIYGMNINLPFQHSPSAFSLLMFISVLLAALFVLVLWKKRYL